MGDKTVRKSNPITRFLILIVVRIPEKTFVVDVWEKETAFIKLLKKTTAGGGDYRVLVWRERARERPFSWLRRGWMDGWWVKQTKTDWQREREREREREAFSFFFFYIGLIEEKYAITAAALSCVVLRYDNERIINRGQERWGKEWDDRQAQQKNWD